MPHKKRKASTQKMKTLSPIKMIIQKKMSKTKSKKAKMRLKNFKPINRKLLKK